MDIVEQFGNLVKQIGFAGAFAFFLFIFNCYLFRKNSKIHEKAMADVKDTYERELERHIEEKRELQQYFLKQLPSSSKDRPEDGKKE